MQSWWIAPGLAVIAVSLVLTVTRFILALTRRPNLRMALLALRLRQIGIGLTLVGLGGSFFVPALFSGPDLGLLIVGGLVAGMGGLYFISASDSMFKTGAIAVPHWRHRAPDDPRLKRGR